MSALVRSLPLRDWCPKDGCRSFLYAVQYKDGRVKIGVTIRPLGRISTLEYESKQLIVKVALAACPRGSQRWVIEGQALRRARRVAVQHRRTKETFLGLKFGEARNFIRQATRGQARAKAAA